MSLTHRSRVFLSKNLRRTLLAGHPWVFSDALRAPKGLLGGWADLYESGSKGRFVARGFYDPDSPIAFRALSTSSEDTLNTEFIQNRIQNANDFRNRFLDLKTTNAYRILHGEGDFLPGIICDRYNDTLVLRYDSDIARKLYEPVLNNLFSKEDFWGFHINSVLERKGKRGQAQEALTLFGKTPKEEIGCLESGMTFGVDVKKGQKTGFFLDQRDNRFLVKKLSKNKRVLNCFSYTGGFTIAAALGGAKKVTSVDSAAPAIEFLQRNLSYNQIQINNHVSLVTDAFTFLEKQVQKGVLYDLVILDPPSFAPSERAKPKAKIAYRELNQLGLQVLAKNGILCTASCSSHITHQDFLEILRDASRKRNGVRVMEIRGAGLDHPVLPAFPEGRYLKFFVLSCS